MSDEKKQGARYDSCYINFPKDSGGDFVDGIMPSSIKLEVLPKNLNAFLDAIQEVTDALKEGEGLKLTLGTSKSKFGAFTSFFGNMYVEAFTPKGKHEYAEAGTTKSKWVPKSKATTATAPSTRISNGKTQRV